MKLSKLQEEKLKKVYEDPVLWAKAHIITYDNEQKKYVPWTARWYQAEMLRDKSRKKVYRCGRRTGVNKAVFATASKFERWNGHSRAVRV